MNLKVEFHYAILISLLILLWLSTEFMLGLQDVSKYIAYQPYVNFLAVIIPFVCIRMAVRDKIEELNGKLGFKDAFLTGFKVTALSAILSIPTQLIFLKLINPDFFDNMIEYSVNTGSKTKEVAAMYFNSGAFIGESVVFTFIFGTIISLVWAWRMQTVK